MRTHSLTSDTTVVVFTDSAAESLLEDLSHKPSYQRQFLSRLHDALTSPTPSAYVEKPFSGCENLMQFRAGDVLRGYCVYTDDPPSYNVFYLFQVTEYEYDREPVRRYDPDAGDVLDELRSLPDEEAVERYLEANDALDAEDVETLFDRGQREKNSGRVATRGGGDTPRSAGRRRTRARRCTTAPRARRCWLPRTTP